MQFGAVLELSDRQLKLNQTDGNGTVTLTRYEYNKNISELKENNYTNITNYVKNGNNITEYYKTF